jgi:exopolysaccharide biosynthesis polyprenyl glycosylphosphotransferase
MVGWVAVYRPQEYRAAYYPYLVDLPLALVALVLADRLRHTLAIGLPIEPDTVYLSPPVYAIVVAVWVTLYPRLVRGDGRQGAPVAGELGRVTFGITAAALCVASLFYLVKIENFSRVLFGYFVALTLLLVAAARLGLRWWWRRRVAAGREVRRALVIGAPDAAARLAAALAAEAPDVRIAGYAAPDGSAAPCGEAGGVPCLGPACACAALAEAQAIDVVYVVLEPGQRDLALRCVEALQALPVHVYIVPDFVDLFAARATLHLVGGMPLLALRAPVLPAWDAAAKRLFDVVVSAAVLIVLAPLFALIALAIKLDSPGPVFFVQTRAGENGRPFRMYKFRSMVADAEARLAEVVDLGSLAEPAYKLRHDPRVTRVGRVLRRWSLDELPQLWNVLKGDMSLVGPRPEDAALVARYTAWQRKRLAVKPGLTGPMQVNGRGDLSLEERVRLELRYIQQYSLWEDIRLLLRTVPAVLSGRGAY